MQLLLTVIETNLYMGRLLTANGLSQSSADTMKGIYNMAQTIFNMPCAFMIPIATSVLPAITSHLTLERHDAVRSTEESAARIAGLVSLPCAIGLTAMAKPLMALLGGYRGEKLELASVLMAMQGVSVFFYAIIQYTNAVLQAHNQAHIPVINMLLCGACKLGIVYMLVGNPEIGIVGAPIGMAVCYMAIAILNLVAIRKAVPQKPALVKNLIRPLIPSLLMGAGAYGTFRGLVYLIGGERHWLLLCIIPVLVAMAIYLAGAAVFKTITASDCRLLPHGDKIARFLRLK